MKKTTIMLLLAAVLMACNNRKAEKTGLEGKPLPSFSLFLADSATYFNTGSIASENPVVLLYFGPHCPYSRVQMKEIIEHMNILKGIKFYMFTTAQFEEMKSFYSEYQLNKYANITVGIDYTGFFGDYFKVSGVPYMAIYGKGKKLREAFSGSVYGKQIKQVAEE